MFHREASEMGGAGLVTVSFKTVFLQYCYYCMNSSPDSAHFASVQTSARPFLNSDSTKN